MEAATQHSAVLAVPLATLQALLLPMLREYSTHPALPAPAPSPSSPLRPSVRPPSRSFALLRLTRQPRSDLYRRTHSSHGNIDDERRLDIYTAEQKGYE